MVDVPRSGRLLYLNSRPQAHDAEGPVRLHRLLGHLPMLLHQAPRDVLVIGLGGGVTPGAVAAHPQARVDVVELVPAVVEGARRFGHVNGDVVELPAGRSTVRLRVDDGRNFMLRAAHAGRRDDVVTADIIRPHHAGAANLYSLEYYRLAVSVLREDGVMLQWLEPGSTHRHRLMMRTFLAVFPHATLWLNGDLLVGSRRPQALDEATLAGRVASGGVDHASLAAVGIDDGPALLQWFLARDDELRAYAGEGPLLVDDRPAIEYFRSLPLDDPSVDLGRLRAAGVSPAGTHRERQHQGQQGQPQHRRRRQGGPGGEQGAAAVARAGTEVAANTYPATAQVSRPPRGSSTSIAGISWARGVVPARRRPATIARHTATASREGPAPLALHTARPASQVPTRRAPRVRAKAGSESGGGPVLASVSGPRKRRAWNAPRAAFCSWGVPASALPTPARPGPGGAGRAPGTARASRRAPAATVPTPASAPASGPGGPEPP